MSENSNPSFSCLHCTKIFGLNKSLIRHCRVFHKDLAQPEHRRSGRKGESSDTTLLKCSLCTKTYTNRSNLQRHKQKQHFQPGLQPHKHRRMEKPSLHEFKDFDGALKVRFYAQHMEHQRDVAHIPLTNDHEVTAESLTSSFHKTETATLPDEFNVTHEKSNLYPCDIPNLRQRWSAYNEHQKWQTEKQSIVCNDPNSEESCYTTDSTNQLQFVTKPIKSADEYYTVNNEMSTIDLQSTPVYTALNGNEYTEMVELTNSTSYINKTFNIDDFDEHSEEDDNFSTKDGEQHSSILNNIDNLDPIKTMVPVHQFTPMDVAVTMMHARKCVQTCLEAVQCLTIAIQCTTTQFLSSTMKAVDKDSQLTALKAYTESIQAAVQNCQERNTEAVDTYEHVINATTVSDEPKQTVSVIQSQTQSYEVFDTHNQATVSNETKQAVEFNAMLCATVREVSQDHTYGISSKLKDVFKIAQQFDHNYFTKDSPRYLKRKFISISNNLIENAKQRKVTLQRIRRLKTSVSSLTDVVTKLRKQNLISESAAEVLNTCSVIPQAVFTRMCRDKKLGHLSRQKYPAELRKFVLTLHFYSPKAYQYIRESFQLCLPHPNVVKSWYQSVN